MRGLFLVVTVSAPKSAPSLPKDSAGRLRFLTCGSVDDGKSTLMGRLMFDAHLAHTDDLHAVKNRQGVGTDGAGHDFSRLFDGLEAEREQGITIDVAYRPFVTANRAFLVADAPGHEAFTPNMATAASNCTLAIILVDAQKGVREQTKRHAAICSLMGIGQIILAVNKMDAVGWSPTVYNRVVADFSVCCADLAFKLVQPMPVCALLGDNVARPSTQLGWFTGPTLLGALECAQGDELPTEYAFRFPVQWVNRGADGLRGYCGTLATGQINAGQAIQVARSGQGAKIARIITADGDLAQASAGQAITLTFDRDIDVGRGDILASAAEQPHVSDQFAARLLWMGQTPLLAGRQYDMRLGNDWLPATVRTIEQTDLVAADKAAQRSRQLRDLQMNAIGLVTVALSRPAAFDCYADNQQTGSFILVDRQTSQTVGAGMIAAPLGSGTLVTQEPLALDKTARSARLGQKPLVLWFTGLSASGKSTLARDVEQALQSEGRTTYMLDGDNLRGGLNADLGFSDGDRIENMRRAGHVAKLMSDAGLIVLCAFISPFAAERAMVRDLFEDGEFVEVFVDTPLNICVERDPKGLYAKAKAGQIKNFTGLDSPYEAPMNPDIHLKSTLATRKQMADQVLAYALAHAARHQESGNA